jgi:hypothetical protein
MIAPECIVARSPDVANGQLQPGPLSTRAARDWKALEAMRRCCDVGKSLAVPVFGQDAWFDRLHTDRRQGVPRRHLIRTHVLATWRVQSHRSLADDADLLNQID